MCAVEENMGRQIMMPLLRPTRVMRSQPHRSATSGNLLQLLHRNRGALSAPAWHSAAIVAARLGADGNLEGCGHSTGSGAARHRLDLREMGAPPAKNTQGERVGLLLAGSAGVGRRDEGRRGWRAQPGEAEHWTGPLGGSRVLEAQCSAARTRAVACFSASVGKGNSIHSA